MSGPRHIVFCDLDGTLVLDNSFHIFLAALWTEATPLQRLSLAPALLLRAGGRWTGGHAGMKRRVLDWVLRQPEDWRRRVVDRTVARLRPTLSAPVMAELDAIRARGGRVVLATAAPELYACDMARIVGAEACIATTRLAGPFRELIRETKAEACRDWLFRQGDDGIACHVTVISDHPDDVPLLAMADRLVVQAPSRRYAEILAALPPAPGRVCIHLDPVAGQEEGGYWLWFDDRPCGPIDRWDLHMILSKHRHALIYSGGGKWRRIGPGQPVEPAARRVDCPLPPSSGHRLRAHLGRRVIRDWLRIYH